MTEERQARIRRLMGRIDVLINVLVRIAMLPVLLCGIYVVADVIGVYADASPASVTTYRPNRIGADTLHEVSEDCVAWIRIDGTTIDYPVMQSDSNTKYLNRDPRGEYSLAGSIFLDCRNSPGFRDAYNVVYGHHMAAGLMFGVLDAYDDEGFFRAHSTGTLVTGDGEFRLEVYAFLMCDASHDEVFDLRGGLSPERLAYFRREAKHLRGDAGSHMVALTTCKSPGATDRTVLLLNVTEGI